MKNLYFIFVVAFLFSCATTQKLDQGYDTNPKTISLLDRIQSLPGVTVNGDGGTASIRVRGINSLSGNNSPLFVVDGTDMGNDFVMVNKQISDSDIKSVRLLKEPSELTIYGVRGANGVITINTRGNKNGFRY